MNAAATFLITQVQGFQDRNAQYKLVKACSPKSSVLLDRFIVKHRMTGDRFLMKRLCHSEPFEIKEQANNELLALQRCH